MDVVKVLSILVLMCSCCIAFDYTSCGSHGVIHSISLEPSELYHGQNTDMYIIRKGQTYTTHINFTATETSTSLTNICHGEILGNMTEFVVKPSNACGNGVVCPLQVGQAEVYTASVTCPSDVPLIKLVAKWEVQDQNGRDLICFVFPVIIEEAV